MADNVFRTFDLPRITEREVRPPNDDDELGHAQVTPATAPRVLLETASQVPLATAPQVPPATAPRVPLAAAPQVLPATAPRVPLATASQVLPATAPRVPLATAPQVPPATAPQVPLASTAQADLDNDSEMWNMYFDEVKEEDIRITDAWKEDANSLVTFTGLFSAIVGAFIIEFYKKLSSDSGDQTVALLQQISHQLPNSPNSAYSNTANQPSPPGTAMVWVNALWLISLVLSLTCALIATLLQQWARRYIETPKYPNLPRHRVRVRSLLLVGTKLYNIPLIVEILPTLLHLSVYLFLGGLVITFHTIHKTVALAVDVAVGVSGLAYIALSILPCLDVRCPYRTPISKILWYPCHALLSLAALCLHRCILGLHRLLNQRILSRTHHILLRWLQSRGFSVSNHWRFLTDGLEKSIVHRAVETLRDGDRGRVTWLFNQLALGDKDKFLKFAASIPRYKIPDLIPPIAESVSFRESLFVLLRSCVARTAWEGFSEDVQLPLLVCLHAIRHIIKAKAPTIPDLKFMQAHFANTGLMRLLWSNMDNSIRITSRSICALVARQVVRKQRLKGVVLRWLQEVIGESSDVILEADVSVLDQMNFKSFVNGALPDHVPYIHLSTEDTTSFNETLAILLDIRTYDHDYFKKPDWQNRLSEEVGRIQRYDRQGGFKVFEKLRLVFPSLPPVTSAHAVIPPPSPRVPPPPSKVPPPRAAAPPRAPPSPRPVPPRAQPPPSPPVVYPPRPNRPSMRAHPHHAPM